MEGFKPILDDMERTFGALDEPSPNGELRIDTINGETITTDAVGIDSLDGGDGICCHFTWEEFDEEAVDLLADELDAPPEEIEKEIDVGEPFVMMNGIIPLDNVGNIQLDSGGLFR